MGKLGKFFLFLIFLIAAVFPPVAVKVRDTMQNQGEEITQFEVKAKGTEEKLQDAREEKKSLKTALDSEKRERAGVEKQLNSTKQQLSTVKDELKKKEADLNSCIVEREKLRENAKKLQEGKSPLEKELAKLTQELNTLKLGASFEKPPTDVTPGREMKHVPGRGRVAGVYGNRYLTISLSSKIGNVTSPIFVHRRGRVLGKTALKKVHGATVVIEAAERELLKKIREGALVQLEGDELLQPELFEGRVSKISPLGFASIEVHRRVQTTAQPVFLIYREDNVVSRIKARRVVSLVIVAELGDIKPGIRVAPKDYLRTPK